MSTKSKIPKIPKPKVDPTIVSAKKKKTVIILIVISSLLVIGGIIVGVLFATGVINTKKVVTYEIYTASEALCGNGTDEKTKVKWSGEVCKDSTIKWNSIEAISGLASKDSCSWKRGDYTGNPDWIKSYLGTGCGDAPTEFPNLPTNYPFFQ